MVIIERRDDEDQSFLGKLMGKSRPAKLWFVRVWLTILPCRRKEHISQNIAPYDVTTQETALLTVTTHLTSTFSHTFFSLKSLPQ
jgi:hypothetical protein